MKHKVIFFNGKPASGKLTIAKMLAEKTGAKIIDNHQVNNLVFNIKQFEGDVPNFVWDFTSLVKKELWDLLAKLPQIEDYIFTGCITKPSANGLQRSKKLAAALNADVYVITLDCSEDEVLTRVSTPERKENKKLSNPKAYKTLMKSKSIIIPNEEHCYTINNTMQTPEETLQAVLDIMSVKN